MGKVKFILLSVFAYSLCALLICIGVLNHIKNKGRLDAIQGEVVVQAEWFAIIPVDHGRAPATYDLGYRYIDENGLIYQEKCAFVLQTYEEAESYMGKKVDIYIDGKGHSIPVYEAKSFNVNAAWITIGIGTGIAVSYTAGLIIWIVIKHRRKQEVDENLPSDMAQINE